MRCAENLLYGKDFPTASANQLRFHCSTQTRYVLDLAGLTFYLCTIISVMKKVLLIVFVGIILFAAFFVYEKKEVKILFVGDMMFDRYIRQVGNSKGQDFVFSCINNFLKDSDMVVGNLEGPITSNPSVSMGSVIESPPNYTFTFPPSTVKLLSSNNIKLVNLGNNHIGNFGQEGIVSTKKYLNDAGVNYFGSLTPAPSPKERGDQIFRSEINGSDISFISYNEFSGDSVQSVAKIISEEKANEQMVFVYAHWGDEYVPPPERVKKLAHSFVDMGAEMVIGSHPHIVQEKEVYKNKFIYYSLGNFIFDQYWNKEVSTGLVLEVDISGGKINVIEHKVSLNRDGRTCLVD
jgi:gamma-polyglutamate biosynthesis protein CapA